MGVFEQIAEIEKEVFSDAWSAEMIRDSFGYDYNHYIAVTWDGCIVTDQNIEEEIAGYLIFSDLDVFELQRIAVRPVYRRRGLADRMMECFIGSAPKDAEDQIVKSAEGGNAKDDAGYKTASEGLRGDGRIILEVRSHNAPAISLYKKYGFTELTVRKNYYRDPDDDALIMERI